MTSDDVSWNEHHHRSSLPYSIEDNLNDVSLLSTIGCVDPLYSNLVVFSQENYTPQCPSELGFVIQFISVVIIFIILSWMREPQLALCPCLVGM